MRDRTLCVRRSTRRSFAGRLCDVELACLASTNRIVPSNALDCWKKRWTQNEKQELMRRKSRTALSYATTVAMRQDAAQTERYLGGSLRFARFDVIEEIASQR